MTHAKAYAYQKSGMGCRHCDSSFGLGILSQQLFFGKGVYKTAHLDGILPIILQFLSAFLRIMDPIQSIVGIDEELPVTRRSESVMTYIFYSRFSLTLPVACTLRLTRKKLSNTKHTAAKSY